MNLVKSILRIDFLTPTNPWVEIRELMRTAASDPKIEMQAAPLVLDRKNERMRIVLQIKAVGIEHETSGPLAQAAADARSMMLHLDQVSRFPDVRRMRYDVIFIEPFDLPFHELVDHLKGRYLKATRLSNLSSDIGLIFDQQEDDLLKHVQLGPMDRAQLASEFLRWADERKIPDTFAFMNLGYWVMEEMAFSEDALGSFLERAVAWQQQEAEALVSDLKEGDS